MLHPRVNFEFPHGWAEFPRWWSEFPRWCNTQHRTAGLRPGTPPSEWQEPRARHHRRSSALEIPYSNLMNREQSIVTFAISNVCLWLVVLLHRFGDMKDVVWLIPVAGITSSISLCLMLYLYFKAKGTKPL